MVVSDSPYFPLICWFRLSDPRMRIVCGPLPGVFRNGCTPLRMLPCLSALAMSER